MKLIAMAIISLSISSINCQIYQMQIADMNEAFDTAKDFKVLASIAKLHYPFYQIQKIFLISLLYSKLPSYLWLVKCKC
jgi:hypothetical protein